jgi:hypothetical protein
VRVAEKLPKFGFRGLRMPGTHLPGVIIAGSYYYYQQGKWAFWDVHDMKKPSRSTCKTRPTPIS